MPSQTYSAVIEEIGEGIADELATLIEIADEIPEQMPAVIEALRKATEYVSDACSLVDY